MTVSLLGLLAGALGGPDPVDPPTYDTLHAVGSRTGTSTETSWAQAPGGTATGRSVHTIRAATRQVRLRYTNTYSDSWTLSAAVEVDGVVTPATFSGSASVTVPALGAVESDPIDVGTLAAGASLPVRTRYTCAPGVSRPWARMTQMLVGEGVSDGDLTLAGSGSVSSSGSVYGIVPQAIVGLTVTPPKAVAHLGDSISEQGNDTTGDEGERAFAARAYTEAGVAWSNQSHWGYATSHFVNTDGTATAQWLAHHGDGWLSEFTAVVSAMGRNDFPDDGRTVQQRHDRALAYWRLIESESGGKPLAVCTITPQTTSTDSWATVANQTVVAQPEPARAAYNAWLRDGAPIDTGTDSAVATGGSGTRVGEAGHPVSAVIEVAGAVEDGGASAPTGKWAAASGDTGMDGTHPGPVRHALMAAPVKAWVDSL